MARTPREVSADLKALHDKARSSFVPPDLKRAAELAAEFSESVTEALEALAAGQAKAAPAKSKAR